MQSPSHGSPFAIATFVHDARGLRGPLPPSGPYRIHSGTTFGLCAVVLALLGCTGELSGPHTFDRSPDADDAGDAGSGGGSPGSAGSGSSGSGGRDGGSAPPAGATSAGPHPLQRLTVEEYRNTVRDLFGWSELPELRLPEDAIGGSGFSSPGVVGRSEALAYLEASEVLASRAVAELSALLPCDPATAGEDACAHDFIARFVRRAYRRPPDDDDLDRVEQVYATARADFGYDLEDGLRLAITAVLSSPSFLYHWERGPRPTQLTPEGLIALESHEIASRLSFFVTKSMPDEALLAAADAGELTEPAVVELHARRLLAAPERRAAVTDMLGTFATQWLELDKLRTSQKDPALFPEYNDALKADLLAETRAFVAHVVLDGDRSWRSLMSAPYSFVNERTAPIYGLANVAGTELRQVMLDASNRFGLLTQGAFLARAASVAEPSPVKRGQIIRDRLFCSPVPPPPPTVNTTPPAPDGMSTVRERFETQHKAPGCNSCHALLDPIGFVFGNYDAIGRIQTLEQGRPIDTSGGVVGLGTGDATFAGAADLVQYLVDSEVARECFTRQWLRYALGREEDALDEPSIAVARQALTSAESDVQELLVAIATSRSFFYRAPTAGEVSP